MVLTMVPIRGFRVFGGYYEKQAYRDNVETTIVIWVGLGFRVQDLGLRGYIAIGYIDTYMYTIGFICWTLTSKVSLAHLTSLLHRLKVTLWKYEQFSLFPSSRYTT